jgi:hypothetical protein
MKVHVFVFCWPGQVENARRIHDAVRVHADALHVIDASAEAPDETRAGWTAIDSDAFYGRQFAEALQRFEGDVLLQIQADAASDDWARLIGVMRQRYEKIEKLGIWAPEIDYTWWTTERARLYDLPPGTGLVGVGQTDCIVWALKRNIVAFLKTLDYGSNRFGWGIDWAAIAFAMVNRQLVLRDTTVSVSHPKGSGYGHQDAKAAMTRFLQQLPMDVAIQFRLLFRAFSPDGL